jgi:DNA polymerase-3 subunit alpha
MPEFTHLHVHSQYSILDGAASIGALINKTKALGIEAIALTDHGTMLGIKEFHSSCLSAEIKPILGCEAYISRRSLHDKKPDNRSGYHLIILVKNYKGYENLMKMMSSANLEGFYSNLE